MAARRTCARLARPLVVAGAIAALLAVSAPAADAATGDAGYRGPSFAGAGSAPSGSKPESKLWWNDGFWWGSLFDTASGDFHIFKLDPATQRWIDTGVPLDERSSSRADVLWNGVHLYVASHVYSTSPASGYPSRLYRFSYDAASDTYTRDPGFPVAINNYKTETLVIEQDSTGKLWATWVQGSRVYVNRTVGGDSTWGTPFVLPVAGTSVTSDDISSLIAFGGNKIGVMWSNQSSSVMHFAVHTDGQPDTTWTPSEAPFSGAGNADDHINLKADRSGRVFAAVKTEQTAASAPLILLLVRDPANGSWTRHVFSRVSDDHTRAIVLLDETNAVVHMFATAAVTGGTIYQKTAPIGAVSFAAGLGTPFIREAASANLNNASSTKQNVTSATGLTVLASNGATGYYWHANASLGPVQPPPRSLTFTPSADARVTSTAPNTNYATGTTLRAGQATTSSAASYRSYLKFDVSGITGPIRAAKLRLYVKDASADGGSLYAAPTGWAESTITWNNAPAITGSPLGRIGAANLGSWVVIDLGAAIAGDGTYSFALASSSADSVYYSSREGGTPPQLTLDVG